MFPAPPSCCALTKRICGRLAMASPMANDVCASTPKTWLTFFELRYSTRVSARLVPAMGASVSLIGLINSGAWKKQQCNGKSQPNDFTKQEHDSRPLQNWFRIILGQLI